MNDDLIAAMADLDEERVLDLVKEKIRGGQTALEIIEQCRKGVEQQWRLLSFRPDHVRRNF